MRVARRGLTPRPPLRSAAPHADLAPSARRKGDWRSISRSFVISRTPTQVASHAQKYFIRLQQMNKKDKKRSSIHDITSVGTSSLPITGQLPPMALQVGRNPHGM